MSYDPEGPTPDIDGELLDESDESLSRRCGECGEMFYADAEVCPYCGAFQIDVEISRRPLWQRNSLILITMIVLLFFAMTATYYFIW